MDEYSKKYKDRIVEAVGNPHGDLEAIINEIYEDGFEDGVNEADRMGVAGEQ